MDTLLAELYRPTGQKISWRRRLKEYRLFFLLFVAPVRQGVHMLYDLDSTHNFFTENSLYHNLGYWKDSPQTLDDACQAMARLVGETAHFGPEDTILDAGFGFADQDIFWAQHFSARAIVGLNIIEKQVEIGRKRVARHQLQDRVTLQVGSATEMSFADGSFDKVVALESAFHFMTRENFFQQACRVLRPGGRLVTVEPLPLPGVKQSWLANYLQRAIVATPKENIYARDVYADKLAGAGFTNISITSIREHVYAPFMSYLSRRLKDKDVLERVNPLIRGLWEGWVSSYSRRGDDDEHDYIIASADKPES
jgi:erythromycin 3''-O-methyltransferase